MTYPAFLRYVERSRGEIANEFALSKYVRPVSFLKKYILKDKLSNSQIRKFMASFECNELISLMKRYKGTVNLNTDIIQTGLSTGQELEQTILTPSSGGLIESARKEFENAMLKSEFRDDNTQLVEEILEIKSRNKFSWLIQAATIIIVIVFLIILTIK